MEKIALSACILIIVIWYLYYMFWPQNEDHGQHESVEKPKIDFTDEELGIIQHALEMNCIRLAREIKEAQKSNSEVWEDAISYLLSRREKSLAIYDKLTERQIER